MTDSPGRPQQYWFRARSFGWGWTPCSLEGWLVLGAYLLADIALWLTIGIALAGSTTAVAVGLVLTVALVVPLIAICYAKGEKPSWHWGRRR